MRTSTAQYSWHLTDLQAGCAGALSGISIPKTCWDNPNPLQIIAGDGYAFLRNAKRKVPRNDNQVAAVRGILILSEESSFSDFHLRHKG